MAFCKVCVCGKKIVFERILGYPAKCPYCTRSLDGPPTYNEDDPRVEELIQTNSRSKDDTESQKDFLPANGMISKKFYLKLSNGKEIPIPDEGGIIGRTELGAEELAEFPSVSRQHIKVFIRRGTVLIEDTSRYGTFVDGQKIIKNEPVRIACGSKITLCNVEAELLVKETVN